MSSEKRKTFENPIPSSLRNTTIFDSPSGSSKQHGIVSKPTVWSRNKLLIEASKGKDTETTSLWLMRGLTSGRFQSCNEAGQKSERRLGSELGKPPLSFMVDSTRGWTRAFRVVQKPVTGSRNRRIRGLCACLWGALPSSDSRGSASDEGSLKSDLRIAHRRRNMFTCLWEWLGSPGESSRMVDAGKSRRDEESFDCGSMAEVVNDDGKEEAKNKLPLPTIKGIYIYIVYKYCILVRYGRGEVADVSTCG